MKKHYFNFSILAISLILVISCKKDKETVTYKKTKMENINICSTRSENLNLNFILKNIGSIEGEQCLDKVTDYVKNHFTTSPNTSLKIIETLLNNNEAEHLLDYSNELFIEHPKLFVDYFKENPNSSILIALQELHSYFSAKHCQDMFKKIEGKTNLNAQDKNILKSINKNLSS